MVLNQETKPSKKRLYILIQKRWKTTAWHKLDTNVTVVRHNSLWHHLLKQTNKRTKLSVLPVAFTQCSHAVAAVFRYTEFGSQRYMALLSLQTGCGCSSFLVCALVAEITSETEQKQEKRGLRVAKVGEVQRKCTWTQLQRCMSAFITGRPA